VESVGSIREDKREERGEREKKEAKLGGGRKMERREEKVRGKSLRGESEWKEEVRGERNRKMRK
jgi:hypothetical protein